MLSIVYAVQLINFLENPLNTIEFVRRILIWICFSKEVRILCAIRWRILFPTSSLGESHDFRHQICGILTLTGFVTEAIPNNFVIPDDLDLFPQIRHRVLERAISAKSIRLTNTLLKTAATVTAAKTTTVASTATKTAPTVVTIRIIGVTKAVGAIRRAVSRR